MVTGVLAWIVGAVASVAVSMLALTVIGGVGGDVQPPPPMAALETGLPAAARTLDPGSDPASPSPAASASPAPSSPAGARSSSPVAAAPPTSTPASPTPGPPRQFSTSGGVLIAQCTGQLAYLVSWSPAAGYRVDDVRRGPATLAQVSFVSGMQELAVGVRCASGVPRLVYVDD